MNWLLRFVYGPVADEDMNLEEDMDYYRSVTRDLDVRDPIMVIHRNGMLEEVSFKLELDESNPLASVDDFLSRHSRAVDSVEDGFEATHRRREYTPFEFLRLEGDFPAYPEEELTMEEHDLDTGEVNRVEPHERYVVEIMGYRLHPTDY